jgi:protein-L-isoaspartate(D-aspartate) O-methyltransferase
VLHHQHAARRTSHHSFERPLPLPFGKQCSPPETARAASVKTAACHETTYAVRVIAPHVPGCQALPCAMTRHRPGRPRRLACRADQGWNWSTARPGTAKGQACERCRLAYLTVREGDDDAGRYWDISTVGPGPRAASLAHDVADAVRDYRNQAPAPGLHMAPAAYRELLTAPDLRFHHRQARQPPGHRLAEVRRHARWAQRSPPASPLVCSYRGAGQ